MPRISPTVRTRQLGSELRRSRKDARIGAEQVASRLGFSMTKVSRFESGDRGAKIEDVASMLTLYNVIGDAREEILKLCREVESGKPGWWQQRELSETQETLIELESTATSIVNYEPMLIPGHLQTGEYTRAVLQDLAMDPEDKIEDRIVTRLARQSVLRKEFPPHLVSIIYEPVLHQLIGGADVMRRQLSYLVHAANHPHFTIRVIPSKPAAYPGLNEAFVKIDSVATSPMVYLEHLTCSLFLEDQTEVAAYTDLAKRLLAVSLDAADSARLIADLATKLDQSPGLDEVTTDDRPEPGWPSLA